MVTPKVVSKLSVSILTKAKFGGPACKPPPTNGIFIHSSNAHRERVLVQHRTSSCFARRRSVSLEQKRVHSNVSGKTGLSLRSTPRLEVRALATDDGTGGKKVEPLWRKELNSLDNLTGTSSSLESEMQQRATMEQDIVRLQKKRDIEKQLEKFQRRSTDASEKSEAQGLAKSVVDKILVADFFFILFILAWLMVGLGEKAVLDTSGLLDLWLPLWPTLFQPALGLFMAGALASALSGYFSKREA